MIRFHVLGVRFCLPLLTLLAPVLALRLGMRGDLSGLAISLCAHELSHILAARCAKVEISEIRILPFGGSARMENPYGLLPGKLAAVAAAGPLANLSLMVLSAALAHWGLLEISRAGEILRASLVLMLFNLLPALPLDGGRILYALLQRPLGEGRALRLGIWLGRILALLLAAGCIWLRLRTGRWNLSFLLAAVFILSSERDERHALSRARVQQLDRALNSPSPRPARLYQMEDSTSVAEALRCLRPKESAWFVLTRNGVPAGMIDGGSILRQVMNSSGGQTLAELKGYTLSASRNRSPENMKG